MKLQKRFLLRAARFLFAVSLLGRSTASPQEPGDRPAHLELGKGVVADAVKKDSEGARAGLQTGDVLLSWRRDDGKGEIESPFDLPLIEIEQAPRGAVTLEGLRGTEKHVWVLGASSWGLHVRPNLPESLYAEGQKLVAAGRTEDAAQYWRSAARAAHGSRPSWLDPWFLYHAGELLADAGQWKEADALFQEAVERSAAESATKVQLLRAWAASFEQRTDGENAKKYYQAAADASPKSNSESLLFADILDGIGAGTAHGDLVEAERTYSQALQIQQRLAPGNLILAKSLNGLGHIARRQGNLAKAEEYHSQALVIGQKFNPGGWEVGASLLGLGIASLDRGDLAKAEEYDSQAAAIYEKISPGSMQVAISLLNLAIVVKSRGDLSKAEEYNRQALAIKEKLAPGSLTVARTLENMGLVAIERGDLAKAEEYCRQALAIMVRLSPRSLDAATGTNNLADLVHRRGDLAQAEKYYRQALAILEEFAPSSLGTATVYGNLALAAVERGDLAKAEEYNQQALAIQEKLFPDSLTIAYSLENVGLVATKRGDLTTAEEYHRKALAIRERLAPGSIEVAESLANLGNVVRERDLAKAEEYYRRGLAIWEKLASEKRGYAETLAALAEVLVKKQQLDAAGPFFERALSVLENQISHLGGSEDVRSGFRANHLSYYHDYADLLMRQKQPEKALEVVERSRARSLLEMLAAAHVDVRKGVDAALLEQERSLAADIAAKTNRRIHIMGEARASEQIAAVNQEIAKLLAEHKDVEDQIRVSSPGYAALTRPQPLGAKQVQELLDADTLLLEYSLGKERSYVWAVTGESLAAYELPKQQDIEDAARKVYQLLTAPNQVIDHETGLERRARSLEAEREYPQAAAALSSLVLGPVAAQLKEKRRLVVVSDGALQYVPFAALPEPGDNNTNSLAHRPPLVIEHEIVSLPSASVLAVLRREKMGRAEATKTVAVLADPVFNDKDARLRQSGTRGQRESKDATRGPLEQKQDAFSFELTRSATDLGLATNGRVVLSRLPWTRREADDILAVTPAGQGRKLLDFAANHAAATDPALGQYRIVHFATHGLLDDKNPELSGLVLSLVNERGRPRDGFLGLREIYNLNLPVELVVLSGCQTGLGKEMQGEGLIGLTRGFMYAGASRVVASLWSVSDAATAELMAQFYRDMEQKGMPPAAALRSAQISMWKQKIWKSPYYWAAFQIQGEWK